MLYEVITFLAFLPAMAKAQALDLRLVVGVLTAGDFVVIDLGGTAAQFSYNFV